MHRAPNGSVLKIAPPNISFINLTDSCKFKDFLKKLNAHIFFIFKARLLIFWAISHANDLVTGCDQHNDRTRLSPVLGCGSLRPPPHENITVKYPMTDRVNELGNVLSPFFVNNSLIDYLGYQLRFALVPRELGSGCPLCQQFFC